MQRSGIKEVGENNLFLKKVESAGKPGSVVNSHLSGMCVTTHLKRPTRIPARVMLCS